MSESSIRALAEGVIDSKENLNNLVDLLEHLQSPSPAVLKWTCEAISTAYEHIVFHNYLWLVHPQNSGKACDLESKNEVVSKFQEWMKKNYTSCKEELLKLLSHDSHDVQEAALDALMSLIKAEGTSHILTLHTYTFPNSLLHQVTGRLLDNQTDMNSVICHFSNYLIYDDVRFHWMKNIASVLSFKKKSQSMEQLVKNAFSALRPLHLHMATDDSCLNQFFAGCPPLPEGDKERGGEEGEKARGGDEEEDGERAESAGEVVVEEDEQLKPPKPKKSRSEVRALDVQTYQKHKKQFSDAWLAFLRLQLSSTIHKTVLVILHSEVMPHLMDPRLLLDYLVDSYDSGGVVSLLALNGLFILMHQYHLDYPDFYPKLYGLLEPSVFHVKYMPRFFSLMDTFLSSTHLPLYMVAAFGKKVARLALNAPPQGVMVAVVFVINLLKRHPNCTVLLHRKNGEGVSLENDPFLIDERDMSICQALESCLWELKTLQSHYCPEVSLLVSQLLNSVNKKSEEDIGKYLDRTSDEMLAAAATKISDAKEVPLNFEIPATKWELD